jgi:mRNA-degrading endonuclease HigB of HigAB toxin-antitoxin module
MLEMNIQIRKFPVIRTEQLHSVFKNRDIVSSDTVVIHVDTNDLRRTANRDYVIVDVYDFVNAAKTYDLVYAAKTKFSTICMNVQLDVTIYSFILETQQLYMFRAFLAHLQE